MSYNDRFRYLKLHSLKGRRDRGGLIQPYKIYNGVDDVNFHSLFSPATSSLTKNSEGKILVRHCNTNMRKFSPNRSREGTAEINCVSVCVSICLSVFLSATT